MHVSILSFFALIMHGFGSYKEGGQIQYFVYTMMRIDKSGCKLYIKIEW